MHYMYIYVHFQVEKAYNKLESLNIAPRGFAFWNILDEGKVSQQDPDKGPVYLAKGLNNFLHIRSVVEDNNHDNK
jgi:hypothetical protein